MDKNVNPIVREFRHSRWQSINRRTVNGRVPRWWCKQARFYLEKGIRLEMTKQEFYSWCAEQSSIIVEIYKQGEIPSIDRIDNEGNYRLDNLQVISMRENVARRNNKSHLEVLQKFAALKTKFCLYCGKKLVRKTTKQRPESLIHFKKRVTCGRSCAMYIQMQKQKEKTT